MPDSAAVPEPWGVKDRLELLPIAFQRKMLRHARIRQWSIALGVCAVFSLAICVLQHRDYQVQQQVLELQRLRAAPLEALRTQNDELRKQLAQLRDDQQLRVELECEQLAFHVLSTVSRSAATCTDGVQVQQFFFSRTKSTVVTPPSQTNTDGQSGQPEQTEIETLLLTVKGIGADNLTVSRFVVALRDSQMFDKVDLKSSMGGAGQARGIRAFVVECTL